LATDDRRSGLATDVDRMTGQGRRPTLTEEREATDVDRRRPTFT
jgi:hypothetical protein